MKPWKYIVTYFFIELDLKSILHLGIIHILQDQFGNIVKTFQCFLYLIKQRNFILINCYKIIYCVNYLLATMMIMTFCMVRTL